MNNHNNIKDELKELNSLLADMPRSMPYAVPQGYFNQLPEHAAAKVMAGDRELTIKHDAPYEVPAGYFEQLPSKIMAKVTTEETGNRRVFVPRAQWLTAAMLAMIISIGGFITFSTHKEAPEQMLSSVPQAELQSYVQTRYALDVNEVLKEGNINDLNIDNKDIIAYLNETGWE